MGNLSTYWNTIKYLKPIQLAYQIRNKFCSKKRIYFENLPVPYRDLKIAIPELDCNEFYAKRFKSELIAQDKVCLLNKIVNIDYHPYYTQTLKPLIVNNVFYFEYGITLGALYRKTKDISYWEQFKKCYDNYLNAHVELKSVYSMALHIPNVLIALELFGETVETEFKEKIYCELYSQYLYIASHQEKHLLANHYFEDLKSLIIASYLFKEDKKLKSYLKDFKKQCEEQILNDGVHYELSLMYHKLILEDVMRIALLAKQPDFPVCNWLLPLIQKMIDACYSLEKGIGRTPLFNDAGNNVAKTCEDLCHAAEIHFGIQPVLRDSFEKSGYYKLYDGDKALILDAGKIGVEYQPAHGHCDCLSFELAVDGKPLFVNSGTYEYQGNLRSYFRSTRAHNTIEINEHEQSLCWGGFRVAKRIGNVYVSKSENSIEGSYTNYVGEKHYRTISLREGMLKVSDCIKASSNSIVKSYLHVAPGFQVTDNTIVNENGKIICKITPLLCRMEKITSDELSYYAPEFGKLEHGSCLVFSWNADNNKHGYLIDFNI